MEESTIPSDIIAIKSAASLSSLSIPGPIAEEQVATTTAAFNASAEQFCVDWKPRAVPSKRQVSSESDDEDEPASHHHRNHKRGHDDTEQQQQKQARRKKRCEDRKEQASRRHHRQRKNELEELQRHFEMLQARGEALKDDNRRLAAALQSIRDVVCSDGSFQSNNNKLQVIGKVQAELKLALAVANFGNDETLTTNKVLTSCLNNMNSKYEELRGQTGNETEGSS